MKNIYLLTVTLVLLFTVNAFSNESKIQEIYTIDSHPLIVEFLEDNPNIYEELSMAEEEMGEKITSVDSIELKYPNFFSKDFQVDVEECFTSADFIIQLGSKKKKRRISIYQRSFGFYKDSNCPNIQIY